MCLFFPSCSKHAAQFRKASQRLPGGSSCPITQGTEPPVQDTPQAGTIPGASAAVSHFHLHKRQNLHQANSWSGRAAGAS